MRAGVLIASIAVWVSALLPVAAHAQKFHQFYIAGATAQVTAAEDIETASTETNGLNDKAHMEFTLSYGFVKPHGVVGYGTLLVPFSGPTKPLSLLSGGATVKAKFSARANGQKWIRTGSGEDTSGHYATWSCDFPSATGKSSRAFAPVAVGSRYAVRTQAGGSFLVSTDAAHCTESEPGAAPSSFGLSGDRKTGRAELLQHVLTGRELRASRATLTLGQAFPGPVDCHNTADAVACTDTISAAGTVKLVKACRKPARVIGRSVRCDDATPLPR